VFHVLLYSFGSPLNAMIDACPQKPVMSCVSGFDVRMVSTVNGTFARSGRSLFSAFQLNSRFVIRRQVRALSG
jgi:hypothetical protein